MKLLILEDERAAVENLVEQLWQIDEKIHVTGSCSSVQEGIKWLNLHPAPDLIVMDVQLADGLSFNIFSACHISCPVIFITGCTSYITQALEYNSIDYLIKPIGEDQLRGALRKYNTLQNHFVNNHASFFRYVKNLKKTISRILVRKGMEYQAIPVEDIVYLFTEYKLVFLVDKENKKYLSLKSNLGDLEEELDKNLFFRANRKYIVNANYIKKFKSCDRCRLTVDLLVPPPEVIVISQDNATAFKKWISQEEVC